MLGIWLVIWLVILHGYMATAVRHHGYGQFHHGYGQLCIMLGICVGLYVHHHGYMVSHFAWLYVLHHGYGQFGIMLGIWLVILHG